MDGSDLLNFLKVSRQAVILEDFHLWLCVGKNGQNLCLLLACKVKLLRYGLKLSGLVLGARFGASEATMNYAER